MMMSVKERIIGPEPYSLKVSPIGLGCMELSISRKKHASSKCIDESEALDFIISAWRNGVRLFDTADYYGFSDKKKGFGHNELLLGNALKKLQQIPGFKREEVVVSTKVGIEPEFSINNSQEYICKAVENSLQRLGEETIDLLYVHRFDAENYRVEDTMRALKLLVDQNKVRCIGLSEVSLEILDKAHKIHPITALQIELSPWHQTPAAKELVNYCNLNHIGVIISTPLGRGFFSEDKGLDFFNQLPKNDFRSIFPRFKENCIEANLIEREKLAAIANNHFKCSLPRLILAWLLAQSSKIVPIPGTTNLLHLKDNLAAGNMVLTEKDLELINAVISESHYKGANEPTFSELKEKMSGKGYFFTDN
jgi:aryl-alcohol dehydrogenase-like predicted oxidoreductase